MRKMSLPPPPPLPVCCENKWVFPLYIRSQLSFIVMLTNEGSAFIIFYLICFTIFIHKAVSSMCISELNLL